MCGTGQSSRDREMKETHTSKEHMFKVYYGPLFVCLLLNKSPILGNTAPDQCVSQIEGRESGHFNSWLCPIQLKTGGAQTKNKIK